MKPGEYPPIDVTLPEFRAASTLGLLLEQPIVKALVPVLVIALVAPIIWRLFRTTWAELDREAREEQLRATGPDYQAPVALVLLAVTLTLQDYYGGRQFFDAVLKEPLSALEAAGHGYLQVETYGGLYGFGWWVLARVLGYVVAPIVLWKVLFPGTKIVDFGLRGRGFASHLGLYALSLGAVLVAMAIVARQPDFLSYYPFYKTASRSWFDFLAWEAMYFLQFFALEFYFRGFLLGVLKKRAGSMAIFAVAVPYCMIHFGKPYLEVHGAIVAGVVLGSLAARTSSIYAGFLVHITVAGLMDFLALAEVHGLPHRFWPP